MVQGDFSCPEALETVGRSECQFGFVIEAFDSTAGSLTLGAKPIQKQRPVFAKHPGDFFHGLDSGSHGAGAPAVEVPSRPIRRDIPPAELEILLEQISPHSLEVAFEQFGQLDVL